MKSQLSLMAHLSSDIVHPLLFTCRFLVNAHRHMAACRVTGQDVTSTRAGLALSVQVLWKKWGLSKNRKSDKPSTHAKANTYSMAGQSTNKYYIFLKRTNINLLYYIRENNVF